MGPYPFLSPAWVEAALALREEMAQAAPAAPQRARVNLVVTDIPFDSGEFHAFVDTFDSGEFHAFIDTEAGGLLPVPGSAADPDATVFFDYQTALSAFVTEDPEAFAHGFLTGALRVEGDLVMVLTLFGEGMSDEQAAFAQQVQARLRAFTLLQGSLQIE